MESKIPVPTDNIFKFYALFGLLLFIFSFGSLLYVNKTTNDLIFKSVVELETLKEQKDPSRSAQAKIAVWDRVIEIELKNRSVYTAALVVLSFIGGMTALYGFSIWHTRIQPMIDETQKVQLEIAKLQLAKFQAEQAMEDVGQA